MAPLAKERRSRRIVWALSCGLLISHSSSFSSVAQNTCRDNHARRAIGRPHRFRAGNTVRRMTFRLPDNIMERLSTQELLDRILDEGLRTSARHPIMKQFDPSSKAIWKHWQGTIFAETWKSCVRHVVWAVAVYLLFRRFPSIQAAFSDFGTIWIQVLSVTTFTLTFFVNESYQCWRTCLTICRTLQGRLNDLVMALAGCAKRTDPPTPDGTSKFTPASRSLMAVVARYIRLFNILSYASFTRSHRPLLTPSGMRRMVSRGLLTAKEREVLIQRPIPATQRHNAVLMWVLRTIIEGRKAGHFDGGSGFEQQMMAKTQDIRAQANSMESVLTGRMPFAYAHIVQVLVDAVLWTFPLKAFSSGMSLPLGLMGTAVLTSCYQGLFDLSKQFLDPFHNENFWQGDDPLVVDTLIAETNAGSLRWMYGLDEMPIPYQSFRDGDLSEYILPDEGFTSEEADKKEEEKRMRQQEEEARSAKTLTIEEYEEKAAEMLEAAEEEMEETKKILSAPPGLTFVPGLDDQDNPDIDDEEETADEELWDVLKIDLASEEDFQ